MSELLTDGQAALERADWESARTAFATELEQGDSPEALDGLGQALWFLGHVAEAIAARERAFDGYVAAGKCDQAARMAVWVSHQHYLAGRVSAARGWLARSERALEGLPSCAGHGWVAVEHARHNGSVEAQVEHARRALSIARAHNVGDLEVFALSVLGRAEISAGRREEGMALLEEALAAASAGRARNLHVLGEAYCNMIEACSAAGEWDRAREWCEMVDRFARENAAPPLFGACRTIHADVLLAAGRWTEAEDALETALETHAGFIPQMGAPAVAKLAELRVRQGRLGEAEQLLAGREEAPSALRALALLRIAEGRPRAAAALLERGLRGVQGNAVQASQMLSPLVDARLACGDADGAREAAAQLARLAAESEIRLIEARARLAAARVADAPEEAAEAAQAALAAFSALAMPLDAAEARLELARAIDDRELAADEARAALAAFREVGGSRGVDAASALLRDLGGGTAARMRVSGELTAREREVLDLLALGMSNAQIARSLVISEKTAGHHVSRILMKLGARNRTEAVMLAAPQR